MQGTWQAPPAPGSQSSDRASLKADLARQPLNLGSMGGHSALLRPQGEAVMPRAASDGYAPRAHPQGSPKWHAYLPQEKDDTEGAPPSFPLVLFCPL